MMSGDAPTTSRDQRSFEQNGGNYYDDDDDGGGTGTGGRSEINNNGGRGGASSINNGGGGGGGGGGNTHTNLTLRPVFLGNLRPTYNADDIFAIFHKPIVPPGIDPGKFKPIPVERLDQKRGYCFVFLKDAVDQEDKDNVEQFVEAISGMEVNHVSNALRAEFSRGDGKIKRKEDERRKFIQPSETLFVVNFHEETTKREDLQMLFEPFGELLRIDMKRNYAFIQFRTIEEATRAKDVTNGGQLEGAVLTVEYVARRRMDDDHRRGGSAGGGRSFHREDRRGGDYYPGDRRGGGGDDRYDRGPPPDRYDRSDRDFGERGGGGGGRDRYDDRRGRGGNDDYRRDRYSPEYSGTGRAAVGGGAVGGGGGYRGERGLRSPLADGPSSYSRRSRSRSRSPPRSPHRSQPRSPHHYHHHHHRSPPRHRDDRGGYDRDRGGYDRDRGGYDRDRGSGARYDTNRDRLDDIPSSGGGGGGRDRDRYDLGRDVGRGRSPDMYHRGGGREDRGYRD